MIIYKYTIFIYYINYYFCCINYTCDYILMFTQNTVKSQYFCFSELELVLSLNLNN